MANNQYQSGEPILIRPLIQRAKRRLTAFHPLHQQGPIQAVHAQQAFYPDQGITALLGKLLEGGLPKRPGQHSIPAQ